jgi:hypothetical protein
LVEFTLHSAALFVEGDGLRTIGATEAFQVTRGAAAAPTLEAGLSRLNLAFKLVNCMLISFLTVVESVFIQFGEVALLSLSSNAWLVFDSGDYACNRRFPFPVTSFDLTTITKGKPELEGRKRAKVD